MLRHKPREACEKSRRNRRAGRKALKGRVPLARDLQVNELGLEMGLEMGLDVDAAEVHLVMRRGQVRGDGSRAYRRVRRGHRPRLRVRPRHRTRGRSIAGAQHGFRRVLTGLVTWARCARSRDGRASTRPRGLPSVLAHGFDAYLQTSIHDRQV